MPSRFKAQLRKKKLSSHLPKKRTNENWRVKEIKNLKVFKATIFFLFFLLNCNFANSFLPCAIWWLFQIMQCKFDFQLWITANLHWNCTRQSGWNRDWKRPWNLSIVRAFFAALERTMIIYCSFLTHRHINNHSNNNLHAVSIQSQYVLDKRDVLHSRAVWKENYARCMQCRRLSWNALKTLFCWENFCLVVLMHLIFTCKDRGERNLKSHQRNNNWSRLLTAVFTEEMAKHWNCLKINISEPSKLMNPALHS